MTNEALQITIPFSIRIEKFHDAFDVQFAYLSQHAR